MKYDVHGNMIRSKPVEPRSGSYTGRGGAFVDTPFFQRGCRGPPPPTPLVVPLPAFSLSNQGTHHPATAGANRAKALISVARIHRAEFQSDFLLRSAITPPPPPFLGLSGKCLRTYLILMFGSIETPPPHLSRVSGLRPDSLPPPCRGDL